MKLFLRGRGVGMIVYRLCLWVGILLLSSTSILAIEFPRPVGAVNDYAGVLSAETRTYLERLAREVWDKTGTAIVVAVMPTIGDSEVNDYVNRLYSAWGIGRKGEDKGVLIFVAVKERKMRIETGYGVEGILPDGLVGEIRDKYMIPYLRQGDYDRGLSQGMEAIAAIVMREAGGTLTGKSPVKPGVKKGHRDGVDLFGLIVFLLLALFFFGTRAGRSVLPWIILGSMMGGHRGGYSGGSFGGFGGGFGGFGGGMSGGGGAGGSF
ncbi:MAG TPA: TPM domain-containing protein [Syntrophales bacterium]|nr:TPM domain-containing protein [Syntrophales bacterium]HPO36262.1 TPM domain-containing protein [Syntrophales bacterium]